MIGDSEHHDQMLHKSLLPPTAYSTMLSIFGVEV